MLTLTLAALSVCSGCPQQPVTRNKVVSSGGGRGLQFVDFTPHLSWTTTRLALGKVGKFRDGKRERIKDPKAHVGSTGVVSRVSGTQFFRVKTRSRLALDEFLVGPRKVSKLDLAFEAQLARMPDGSMRRQIVSKTLGQAELKAGTYGMWILEAGTRRKKTHTVLHVIPQPAGMTRPAFVKDMQDMLVINQRLAQLKAALEEAQRGKQRGKPMPEIRKALDAVLAAKRLVLRNPENDRWIPRALAPWEERLRAFQ